MKETDVTSTLTSQRHSGSFPYVHKVGKPPKQNLLTELSNTFKETFFSDDPLRPFKDQPRSRKFILGLEALFPIISWSKYYTFAKFKGDLIAGLTIASLCIPQVIMALLIMFLFLVFSFSKGYVLFKLVFKASVFLR